MARSACTYVSRMAGRRHGSDRWGRRAWFSLLTTRQELVLPLCTGAYHQPTSRAPVMNLPEMAGGWIERQPEAFAIWACGKRVTGRHQHGATGNPTRPQMLCWLAAGLHWRSLRMIRFPPCD